MKQTMDGDFLLQITLTRIVNPATKTFNRPAIPTSLMYPTTPTHSSRLIPTTWAATTSNTTSMGRMEEAQDKFISQNSAAFKGSSMKRIRVKWEASLMLGTFMCLNQAQT